MDMQLEIQFHSANGYAVGNAVRTSSGNAFVYAIAWRKWIRSWNFIWICNFMVQMDTQLGMQLELHWEMHFYMRKRRLSSVQRKYNYTTKSLLPQQTVIL
jgi:hypothetical protein